MDDICFTQTRFSSVAEVQNLDAVTEKNLPKIQFCDFARSEQKIQSLMWSMTTKKKLKLFTKAISTSKALFVVVARVRRKLGIQLDCLASRALCDTSLHNVVCGTHSFP